MIGIHFETHAISYAVKEVLISVCDISLYQTIFSNLISVIIQTVLYPCIILSARKCKYGRDYSLAQKGFQLPCLKMNKKTFLKKVEKGEFGEA